jgi:hypothetical protein
MFNNVWEQGFLLPQGAQGLPLLEKDALRLSVIANAWSDSSYIHLRRTQKCGAELDASYTRADNRGQCENRFGNFSE